MCSVKLASQQDCPYAKQALDGGSGGGIGSDGGGSGVALCDSFSSLDHVAAVYTVASSFLSQSRPYVDDDLDGLAGRPADCAAEGSRPTVECIFRGCCTYVQSMGDERRRNLRGSQCKA